MSYLKNNERYTADVGGGESDYNFVNIEALHIFWVADSSPSTSRRAAGKMAETPRNLLEQQ
jgi:hypothetical protein